MSSSSPPSSSSIVPFRDRLPSLGEGVFIAPGARVIGRVKLAARASVWFGSVLRGDVNEIEIGEETNIQDLSMVHCADPHPCIVGARVVAGHRVILHGCRVGDECTIGMGAILLNGCEIGAGSIVAAGSLVTEGKKFPPRSMLMGSPAKLVRETTDEEVASTLHFAAKYARLAAEYRAQFSASLP